MTSDGHVVSIGRSTQIVLVGKPDEKRPTGRPKLRWKDNIKNDLQEVLWRVWTGLTWLRIGISGGLLSMAVMSIRIP